MNYSIRSSEEAEGRALSALVTGPQRVTIDSVEKKASAASIPVAKQPADEAIRLLLSRQNAWYLPGRRSRGPGTAAGNPDHRAWGRGLVVRPDRGRGSGDCRRFDGSARFV